MDCNFVHGSRLLYPWNSPGKNAGVVAISSSKGIFLTQGLNSCFLHLLYCRWILYCLSHCRSPWLIQHILRNPTNWFLTSPECTLFLRPLRTKQNVGLVTTAARSSFFSWSLHPVRSSCYQGSWWSRDQLGTAVSDVHPSVCLGPGGAKSWGSLVVTWPCWTSSCLIHRDGANWKKLSIAPSAGVVREKMSVWTWRWHGNWPRNQEEHRNEVQRPASRGHRQDGLILIIFSFDSRRKSDSLKHQGQRCWTPWF